MPIPPRMLIRTTAKAALEAYEFVIARRTAETDARRAALLATVREIFNTDEDETAYRVEVDPFGEWAIVDSVYFSHPTPTPNHVPGRPSLSVFVQAEPQGEVTSIQIKSLVDLGRVFDQYEDDALVDARECCVVSRIVDEHWHIHLILRSDLDHFRSLGFEGPQ